MNGQTWTILADGPSLTQEQVDFVRGKSKVLAINYTLQLAPWADIFYYHHEEALAEMVAGVDVEALWQAGELRVITSARASTRPWEQVTFTKREGLELAPPNLAHGGHSGHAAINLALHQGATRIVLLGYDLGERNGRFHWKKPPSHPSRHSYPYDQWRTTTGAVAPLLEEMGVEVLNATPGSYLEGFRRVSLDDLA